MTAPTCLITSAKLMASSMPGIEPASSLKNEPDVASLKAAKSPDSAVGSTSYSQNNKRRSGEYCECAEGMQIIATCLTMADRLVKPWTSDGVLVNFWRKASLRL